MGKDKHARGLEALKSLKNRVPAAAPSRPKIIVPPAPAEPDDATLFRREVARVQPLKADDHAELARPRPVPLPRPKTIEIEPEAPRRPVRIDENDPVAVFRAALGDITPIKDFHRVDLSVQRQQASSQIRAMSQTERYYKIDQLLNDRRVVGFTTPRPVSLARLTRACLTNQETMPGLAPQVETAVAPPGFFANVANIPA